jgi:hypothetical protein
MLTQTSNCREYFARWQVVLLFLAATFRFGAVAVAGEPLPRSAALALGAECEPAVECAGVVGELVLESAECAFAVDR